MSNGVGDKHDLDALQGEFDSAQKHYEDLVDPDYVNKGLQELENFANNPDNAEATQVGDATSETSGAKESKDDQKQSWIRRRASRWGNRYQQLSNARKLAAAGAGTAAIVGLLVGGFSLFSFLNVFRLDHLMSNIEQRSFLRYQVDMSGRSSKWISAYMALRLGEVENPEQAPKDRDNILFRSNRVDNNEPLTDWYKTLRASKFEEEVFNQHGIKFTSVARYDPQRKMTVFRPAQISINTDGATKNYTYNPTAADIAAIEAGDVNKFNGELRQFLEVKQFGSDKEGRKAVLAVVKDNTEWYQVLKRYYLRRSIQNMIGVRSWRIFDGTRTKLTEGKISIRNRAIAWALPDNTKSGKLVQCLFGITACKASTDPNNPANHADTADLTVTCDQAPEEPACQANDLTDDQGNPATNDNTAADGLAPEGGELSEDALSRVAIVKKIVTEIAGKANIATSVVSIVDTLNTINKTMGSHSLSKMVYTARATQAIGMYTVLSLARDQMHSGDLTASQAGDLMKTVDGASTSEGWDTVINNPSSDSSTVSADSFTEAKDKQEYCSSNHQDQMLLPGNAAKAESEYHYLCDSEKIGSAHLAETIQNGWNESVGTALAPVFKAYNGLGISAAYGAINSVVNKLLEPVLKGVMSGLGLDDNLESLMSWAVGKASATLGAGPAVDPSSPSGVYVNHAIEGGAATAEAALRYQGAAATTTVTAAVANKSVLAYENSQIASETFATKYLSLANPQSLFSTALFNISTTPSSHSFSSIFSSISKLPGQLLSLPVHAASTQNAGYAVANWAGVDTYDYPSQCLDTDPLDMTPQNSTNADDLGLIDSNALTWDLVDDSNAFYGKLYQDNPNAGDDVMNQVYDCAILDSTIRGALGARYDSSTLGPNALQTDDSGSSVANTGAGANFNIATLNVYHSDGQSKTFWQGRLHRSVNALIKAQVDIAGLQEVRPNQNVTFRKQDFGGSIYDLYPAASSTGGDFTPNPVIWNKQKFKMAPADEQVKGVPISYFDDTVGQTSQAITVVKLISLPDTSTGNPGGQEFFVANTHDPADTAQHGDNADLRLANAKRYVTYFQQLSQQTGLPIFFTGDFNNRYDLVGNDQNNPVGQLCTNLTYRIISQGKTLEDAYDLFHGAAGSTPPICPAPAASPQNKNAIDHIFASTFVQMRSFQNLGDHGVNSNGSDTHDTVVTHAIIPATGNTGTPVTTPTTGSDFVGNDGFGGGSCVVYVEYILNRHSSKYHGQVDITTGTNGMAAYTVADNLGKLLGYKVDNTPAVHAVVSFPTTLANPTYGHVAIVAQVNADGSIVVEESNWANPNAYGTHTVSADEVPKLTYAHTEVGWQ